MGETNGLDGKLMTASEAVERFGVPPDGCQLAVGGFYRSLRSRKSFPHVAIVCGGRRWTLRSSSTPEPLLGLPGSGGVDKALRRHPAPQLSSRLEVAYAVALRGACAVPLNFRLSAGELVMI